MYPSSIDMTPTPPSVTSSRPVDSPDQFRVVRKRNRIPLSCAPCRHRKLKCNRQHPCDNCIKRGDSGSCAYAAPATRKKGGSGHNSANATPDDMQNRIDRLEGLVLSLMTNGPQSAGPTAANQALSAGVSSIGSGSLGPNLDAELENSTMLDGDFDAREDESETDGVTKSFGIMKVDAEKQKTFYVGEAHWAAVLHEIGEVKSYFSVHKKEYEAQMEKVSQARQERGADAGAGPALLFGATIPPSRSEILAQMPSKYMCDILVGRYFNTCDPAIHILHGPTFQKQYNEHWADSSKSSIVWIAMLFAMIRLAMISYGREGDEPPEFHGKCHDLSMNFRTQMAHCLIMADYTKPHNHLIETLIFHLHAEYSSNRDSEASIWVLVGMIARMAMRMGYHRDSKLFPNVTPFQGEMRRRIWTFVRSADLLFSFQVALPAMIRIGDSDTDLPRNIYDDEFDEDSTALPPSRSANEATPISYMVAKGRLALGFGRVLEEINGVDKKGYDEVLKIDQGLREIYESIPDHLKLRPMPDQTLAPISLILARFSLATVYHKSQCVLHRRFSAMAKTNTSRYVHSRRTCLDSAMQLLSFQAIQHQHTGERGRMRTLRHHVNSLTTHDFLLAATIVCMDLYSHRDKPGQGQGQDFDASTPSTNFSGASGSVSHGSNMSDGTYVPGLSYTREDLIRSLEESRDIWMATRDLSMEAYKASELLNVLLNQIKLPYSPNQSGNGQLNTATGGGQGGGNDEQTAAMTLGLLQAGGMGPNGGVHVQGQLPTGQWDKAGGATGGYQPADQVGLNSGNQGMFGAGNGVGLGAGGAPSPFPSTFFGGQMADMNGMNIDWEAWDQMIQPTNMSLDPASNLWSTNSPNANLFTQTSSPDSNESPFGMNSSVYPAQSIGGIMAESMNMSGNGKENGQTNLGLGNTNTSTGGDVGVGANVFDPSSVPSWKWTVMSDKK